MFGIEILKIQYVILARPQKPQKHRPQKHPKSNLGPTPKALLLYLVTVVRPRAPRAPESHASAGVGSEFAVKT